MRISLRFQSGSRAVARVCAGILVGALSLGAQVTTRQVVDTGVRNTLPARPMMTPRTASGGMASMEGMAGKSTSGSAKKTGGMSSMPGMSDMASTSGMKMSGDSSSQGMMDLQGRVMAALELNARLMADPVIRQRIMGDSTLRGLADRAASGMTSMNMGQMDMKSHDSAPRAKTKTASHASITKSSAATKQSPAPTTSPAKKTVESKPAKKPAEKPMPPMPGMPGMKMP